MLKSNAIDRLLRENPELKDRRYGLPDIGRRLDGEYFNPTVQNIADAINFYGYGVRDADIMNIPDIDLGTGNPARYKPFPLAIERMKKSLNSPNMYKYPYTEGDDNLRQILLDYVEKIGFINNCPYSYPDVDSRGLSVHNLTFLPSTSIAFNLIINIISKPGDVVIVPAPNYGLFTIRAERAGAEVELLELSKDDNWLVNPTKLAKRIDDINESLAMTYHRRKGYVPRVVAFLNMNPSNPTGKIMGKKELKRLEEISRVCLERGVFIIDDLVYRDLAFKEEDVAIPVASIPGMFRNTISLFGLSKSYGLASLRAGFVVADEIIIRELINRIFQEMDSSPDIVGQALAGAFNTSKRHDTEYKKYFQELRNIYYYKYNLVAALVDGIDKIDPSLKDSIKEEVNNIVEDEKLADKLLDGMPYVHFPQNLKPDAGFFVILDFSQLKGMKYRGIPINTERDLLQYFYKMCRLRFLVGQSISWPYQDELVGRISFALDDNVLINALKEMHLAILKLDSKDEYLIRKNILEDQAQMARIKVDGWRNAYDQIIASQYLNSLDYEAQTERYIRSFEEYKDLVLVAVKDDEILGYSCFDSKDDMKYDSELVSLYIKPEYIGHGIGTSLFRETAKELYQQNKNNMIVWCLKENTKAIKFYEHLGGKNVETKITKIGDEYYEEYGFYFDLRMINDNPF